MGTNRERLTFMKKYFIKPTKTKFFGTVADVKAYASD